MAHAEDCVQDIHERRTKHGLKTETLFLMLMGVVILQMIVNVGLFLRMNQLQQEVLAALGSLRSPRVSEVSEGLKVGTAAPSFALLDTSSEEIALDDFGGQRILLVFSSTHCSACAEMYSYLRAFSEGRKDVRVVMISLGPSEENRQLVEKQRFGFPVLTWDETVGQDYKVPGTPFFYVIEKGVIVGKGYAGSLATLEALADIPGK